MANAKMKEYYEDLNARTERAEAQRDGTIPASPNTTDDAIAALGSSGFVMTDAIQDQIAIHKDYAPSTEDIGRAIATLAMFFNFEEPSFTSDTATSYNATAFQQKGMLGNLCNNAKWLLDNAVKHQQDLFTKLDQQEALADGGEISNRNLSITLDQLERSRNVQVPACRDWFELTKAAYAEIVGEDWTPPAKGGRDAAAQSVDAIKARIAQLRGGEVEAD